VELLEHGEQHECDHQPNSDFREPLIVHRGSFSRSDNVADTIPPIATAYVCDFSRVKACIWIGFTLERLRVSVRFVQFVTILSCPPAEP
ncbi:MAG TPA: hypothetical protein PLG32_20290, partial [Piscinibacter sp.]|nr:hypothetical protein [Piscinibacter sp.]